LVFLLASAAIDDKNYFNFKWLWHYAVIGQGTIRASTLIRQRSFSSTTTGQSGMVAYQK
jgi:hypothetical protein